MVSDMRNSVGGNVIGSNRIVSIDVLRALVLLAILIVHTTGSFGFPHVYEGLELYAEKFSDFFFAGRSAKIFGILFGISFYIISHKASYTAKQFVVRCVILILFGLLNKFFYTSDAMMWYGICGLFLIPFRNCSKMMLLLIFVLLYVASMYLRYLNLGDQLFPDYINLRYNSGLSLWEIIKYQPHSIIDYLKHSLNSGVVGSLSRFVLGYLIAAYGLRKLVDIKLKQLLIVTFSLGFFYLLLKYLSVPAGYRERYVLKISMSLIYMMTFFYLYGLLVKVKMNRFVDFLSYYGRLGLTNYSVQGVFGVCFFYLFTPNLYVSYLCMLIFYALQCVASYYWLKRYKQGPLEGLWRWLIDKIAG